MNGKSKKKIVWISFISIVCVIILSISYYRITSSDEVMQEPTKVSKMENVKQQEEKKESLKTEVEQAEKEPHVEEDKEKKAVEEAGFEYEEFESNMDEQSIESTEEDETAAIEQLMTSYVDVFENKNVEKLADLVHPTSEFYNSQYIYLESLLNEKIKVVVKSNQIKGIEAYENETYTVTVKEDYTLNHSSGSSERIKETNDYTVQFIDGKYYMIDMKKQ